MEITRNKIQSLGFQEICHTPHPDLKEVYSLSIGHEVTFGGHYREADDLMLKIMKSPYSDGDWLLYLRSVAFSLQLCDVNTVEQLK